MSSVPAEGNPPPPAWLSLRLRTGLFIAGVVLVVIFSAVRTVHLRADFPVWAKIVRDAVLYSDEGWYANNARALFREGSWHVPGDLNFAVNLPVQQVLHTVFFAIGGPTIEMARFTSVFSFWVLTGLTFLLVWRYADRWTALLAALLMSANFFFLAYSRLALAENTMAMFLLASVCAGALAREGRWWAWTAAAGALFMLAFYTKTSAVAGLPLVLAVLAWPQRGTSRLWQAPLLFVGIGLAAFLLHYFLLARPYREDFEFFHHINVGRELQLNPFGALAHAWDIIQRMDRIDKPLHYFFLYGLPVAIIALGGLRRHPLFLGALFFLICYLGAFSVYANPQQRYWAALSPSLAIIVAMVARELFLLRGRTRIHAAFCWLFFTSLALSFVLQVHMTWKYLSSPDYSFAEMSRQVRHTMAEENARPVLLGHLACTVALFEDVRPVNHLYGPWPLERRLEEYRPTFLVTEDAVEVDAEPPPPDAPPQPARRDLRLQALEERYHLEEVLTFEVFQNYREYPVYLYRLVPRDREPQAGVEPTGGAP